MSEEKTMLDYALQYAARGWPVFPCHTAHDGKCSCGKTGCTRPAKHPHTKNGLKDASTDPEQIRRWWATWPDANIAYAPDEKTVIVDVDIKHNDGKYGDETLDTLTRANGDLPDTVLSLTGGGGLQYFFSTDKPVKNGTDVLGENSAIDTRSKGGYVILPPSVHISGQTYEWEASSDPEDIPLATIPDWLYKALTKPEGKAPSSSVTPETVTEGARNDTLFKLAASMRSKNCAESVILDALLAMNKAQCSPPLNDKEVKRIAASAGKYPPGTSKKHDTPEESVRPTDFTDTANSRVFAREYKGKAIYVKTIGWLFWNGKKWEENELEVAGFAMGLTDKMMAEARAEIAAAGEAMTAAKVAEDADAIKAAHRMELAAAAYRKHAKASRNKTRIAAMLDLARTPLQVMPDMLDADPYILNTPKGMVNLRTGDISPHTPARYCTKITKYGPGVHGADLWQAFLRVITVEDEKLAFFLQQIAGMAAVGSVFEENLIIAIGNGKNGKSAHFNTLAIVLNDYAGTIAAEVLTTANRNKGAEMATLKGKRLVIAAETEEGARLSQSALKQLTSTDRIHAERKYKDPEDFIPSHTTILYTNHLLRVGSTDTGTWRRLVTVPFTAKIPASQEVKNYADTLVRGGGEAIMSWIIEGAMFFCANGHALQLPEAVVMAREEYQAENDWLTMFLDECCELGPGKKVGSGILYSAYRGWADGNGEYKRHNRDFNSEMEKRGYNKHRQSAGWIWLGIGLKYPFPLAHPSAV